MHEMKDALVYQLSRRKAVNKQTVFSDLFSDSFQSSLSIALNGDVTYLPPATSASTSTSPSRSAPQRESFVLMNLNPVETSKSHLAALSLVCHATVFTEQGYSGLAESYQYLPIGVFGPPIGSWGLVTSFRSSASKNMRRSGSSPLHSDHPLLLSLSSQLSHWLHAIQNFRFSHQTSLESRHLR